MLSKPVVQLASTKKLDITFTIYITPIWRACLWINDYVKTLPFMADQDNEYNRKAFTIGSVIIDFNELRKALDMNDLRNYDNSWMINPADPRELFVHFENHRSPFCFSSFKIGNLFGFSFDKTELINSKIYPFLKSIPNIEDKADLLTYQRMSFSTGNVVIDNSSAIFDDFFTSFGNDVNLLELDKNELKEVKQSFIESYNISLLEAVFNIKDKRARLSFKAPIETYTKAKFPFITDKESKDTKLIDKVMNDAYGYCRGVPGTCVNRYQVYRPDFENNLIYNSDGKNPKEECFNNWYEFKFARKITSIETVHVKMKDTEGNDIWTEVFPGLGVKQTNTETQIENAYKPINSPNPIKLVFKNQSGEDDEIGVTNTNKDNLSEYNNDGRIRIYWSQAMKYQPNCLYNRNGDANEVKMTGIFVDLHNPGDIIKDLMIHYSNKQLTENDFDNYEWEKESRKMKPIGICLDQSKSVFDWIELIQNGSMVGFQLMINRNLFTIRADNANREESFHIRYIEILNKADLTFEINGENYATFTSINYLKDYADDETATIVNKTKRTEIIDIFKFEKEYSNDCFLVNKEDVEKKGEIILENFTKVHPIIRNIELDGLRWTNNDGTPSIFLFATGTIDFTTALPRQMQMIQKYMKPRQFLGEVRCKIIGCRRDLREQKTYIDVIQCDILDSLPLPLKLITCNVQILGNESVDSVLTANVTDINGRGEIFYQWGYGDVQNNFIPINGATLSTYTIKENDEEKFISVQVTREEGTIGVLFGKTNNPIPFSLRLKSITANGLADSLTTTQIVMTFNENIPLQLTDITFSDPSITVISMSNSIANKTHTLNIVGITSSGNITINIKYTTAEIKGIPATASVKFVQFPAIGSIAYNIQNNDPNMVLGKKCVLYGKEEYTASRGLFMQDVSKNPFIRPEHKALAGSWQVFHITGDAPIACIGTNKLIAIRIS